MSIKAQISITDERGRVFVGTIELFPQDKGNVKAKGKAVAFSKSVQIKKGVSKITIRLRQFIEEGYFNKTTKRSVNEIREKLRSKGISIKLEFLQSYLTRMVKNDELEREQTIRDNKKVFVYSKP